jgi:hypothetical protein
MKFRARLWGDSRTLLMRLNEFLPLRPPFIDRSEWNSVCLTTLCLAVALRSEISRTLIGKDVGGSGRGLILCTSPVCSWEWRKKSTRTLVTAFLPRFKPGAFPMQIIVSRCGSFTLCGLRIPRRMLLNMTDRPTTFRMENSAVSLAFASRHQTTDVIIRVTSFNKRCFWQTYVGTGFQTTAESAKRSVPAANRIADTPRAPRLLLIQPGATRKNERKFANSRHWWACLARQFDRRAGMRDNKRAVWLTTAASLSALERETGAELRRHRREKLLLLNKEFSLIKPERYRLL